LAARDVGKEVFPYELVLWAPNFPSFIMDNGVEVRVSRRRVSARRHSEKVWEEVEVDGDFINGGRRLYGGSSDWGQALNNVFRRWVAEGRSGQAGWEDSRDGRRDVLDLFDEWEFFDETVEIGSVGGDVGKEVQRFMLNVVELVVSVGEEGFEEEASRWGRDVMIEERRGRGENVLTWEECLLNGGGGGVEVGLVGKTYFGPSGRGNGGGDGGVGVGGVVESEFRPTRGDVDGRGGGGDGDLEDVFIELRNKVGGRGNGTKGEGHLFGGFKQSAPILGDCSNVTNLLLYLSRWVATRAWS